MTGGGEIKYSAILLLAAFFMAQWYLARLCQVFKLPTIPVEIGVGLIFGPHGLDLISEFSHDYSPLKLLGFIGVGFVIFESGMHLNVGKVFNWEVGPHVVIVAVMGTILPICAGIGVTTAMGGDAYPNGLAAGFALAPTSVGISLTLLSRAKQLNSRCGQIIMSAAFLDDIFSIICLVVMTNLAGGELSIPRHVIAPLVSAMAFVGIGVASSVFIMPRLTSYLLDSSGRFIRFFEVGTRSMGLKDEMHMFYMIMAYLLLSWLGHVIGSALLGAFVAGVLFSDVPRSHLVWEKQFKRITRWLLRIFFSATVGFSINISDLFSASAFWRGAIMAVGPCLLTKVSAGMFVGAGRWVVGVAMMARGEFAYLVAEKAHSLELITPSQYAVVVWSLLWATIIAPLAFDKVLKQFIHDEFGKGATTRSHRIGGDQFSGESSFIIRYFGTHQHGMVREVTESLHALGFDVKKSITENNGAFGMGTFEVHPRQALTYVSKYGPSANLEEGSKRWKKYKMATDITDEKLNEIAKYLKETISDANAQIIFEPSEKESEKDKTHILEIEIFGDGYRDVLGDITTFLLQSCSLNIIRAVVDEPNYLNDSALDYSAFYCTKKRDTVEGDDSRKPGCASNGSTDKNSALPSPILVSRINGDASAGNSVSGGLGLPDDKPLVIAGAAGTDDGGSAICRQPLKKTEEDEEEASIILPGGYGGYQSARHIISSQAHISSARIKVSQSHISAARINTDPEVNESDCIVIRTGIRRIFEENHLFECDLLVRMISDTSVVYAPERTHRIDDGDDAIDIDRRMTFSHLDLGKTPQNVAEVLKRLPSTVHELEAHEYDEDDVMAITGGKPLDRVHDPTDNI